MKMIHSTKRSAAGGRRSGRGRLSVLLPLIGLATTGGALTLSAHATSTTNVQSPASTPSEAQAEKPTLAETRLKMGKWIETQQILSKERNDWNQGKEILASRVDLLQREVAALQEKIKTAETSVAETNAKRDELLAQSDRLKAVASELSSFVARMEGDVRKLFVQLPEPLRARLQPLYQRIPDDAAAGRVALAERFQNVIGIVNEVNKANNELEVAYEVRNLANGKPAEVRVMYLGLAQAYYVSASGEAGIGRPGPDGWTWEPSTAVSADVLRALEIQQGKHTPAFVGLPARIR